MGSGARFNGGRGEGEGGRGGVQEHAEDALEAAEAERHGGQRAAEGRRHRLLCQRRDLRSEVAGHVVKRGGHRNRKQRPHHKRRERAKTHEGPADKIE